MCVLGLFSVLWVVCGECDVVRPKVDGGLGEVSPSRGFCRVWLVIGLRQLSVVTLQVALLCCTYG